MEIPDRTLQEARDNFKKSAALAYPPSFSVTPWWKMKQQKTHDRITNFQSSQEAVEYAQAGQKSGFDHRIFDAEIAKSTVLFKVGELERIFPPWRLKESPFLESQYSIKESLVELEGRQVSSIFLSHVNYYLRATAALKGAAPKRVLEIGGGYGALARVFKLAAPKCAYVIVDLPESLFYSQTFLRLNFPDAVIGYVAEEGPVDVSAYDFLLVPVQLSHVLTGAAFDLAINTGSLQEMPMAAVMHWMRFLQETIKPSFFYSFNYFLNNKKAYLESIGDYNEICPVLDPWWAVLYFEINPEVITVDARGRNWLEVCLERLPAGTKAAAQERARRLSTEASALPKGSNEWWARAWMAVWCDSRPDYVRTLIDAIQWFKGQSEPGLPRNRFLGSSLPLFALVKNRIKRSFFPRRTIQEDLNEFSELDYYGALLPRKD